MAKLGSFHVAKRAVAEAANPPEQDTFDFQDEEFRVADTPPSALSLMEFADAMSAADDTDSVSMEALGAMYQMLRRCIEPADWPRFRAAAMKSGAGIDELMPITQTVWEAVTARPTHGPSASPAGPSTASTSSKVASSSPGTARPSWRVDLPETQPVAPTLVSVDHLRPANEWAGPVGMRLVEPLTPVDDLIKRTA